MDLGYSLAGAFVGFLVGLTGVGGGSLMAPLLILLFGFSPAVAIGTDLWFAAITKTAGGLVHHRLGSADWKIVGRLAMGSLPLAVLTVIWLATAHEGRLESNLLMNLLGVALLLTAGLMLLKPYVAEPLRRLRESMGPSMRGRQFAATIVGGAIVGCLVTLTSVGAGALVAPEIVRQLVNLVQHHRCGEPLKDCLATRLCYRPAQVRVVGHPGNFVRQIVGIAGGE